LQPLKAMVKAMSVDGFAIDAGGWKGKTVLHYLALQGGVAELSYLISLVKKIDMATDDKRTALMYACHRTDESAVKCVGLLLEGGASVRAADENGKTALMWAVEETADRAVVAEILKRKPDLDAHDKFGNTALHYCAARTRDAHLTHVIAQMLLDAGADINATNTYGHTALMLLAQNTPKACSLLVQSGAAVDVKDHAGYTVRDYANAESKKVLAELIGKATLPIGHNPKELPITATVVRDKKTLKQIEKASTLRSELVLRIQEWVAVQKGAPDVLEPWPNILLAAQLGSEAIKVGMEQVVPEEVDRMGSMLSGPFFVSKNYPMVEKGYPVVQLDLRLASLLSGKSLGDGLLQLWEIPRKMSLHVRVIPREAVNANLMQPFEVRKLCKQDKTALYPFWESDPAAGVVKMFHSYESLGFQTDDLEYELSEALEEGNTIDSIIERALQSAGLSATQKKNKSNEATKRRLAPAALIKLANRFNESLAEPSGDCNLQLFGTFPFLQYSMVSVGKNCLFTIPYGASGSAQVFFEIDSRGKVSFSTNFTTR
jgi:ankyrin repeat protein